MADGDVRSIGMIASMSSQGRVGSASSWSSTELTLNLSLGRVDRMMKEGGVVMVCGVR